MLGYIGELIREGKGQVQWLTAVVTAGALQIDSIVTVYAEGRRRGGGRDRSEEDDGGREGGRGIDLDNLLLEIDSDSDNNKSFTEEGMNIN